MKALVKLFSIILITSVFIFFNINSDELKSTTQDTLPPEYSLNCQKDTDCVFVKVGCGGCSYQLMNKQAASGVIRPNCEYTTNCYFGVHKTICENNICVDGGMVIDNCYYDCMRNNPRVSRKYCTDKCP